MKMRFRAVFAYAMCACVAGCAVPRESPGANGAARIVSAGNASDAITVGTSTKSDVAAALGKATVISFDSGYEVWVYQYQGDASPKDRGKERNGVAVAEGGIRGPAEFVILFAPSGVVTKSRICPLPPPGAAGR
jgi:hypothetical protein